MSISTLIPPLPDPEARATSVGSGDVPKDGFAVLVPELSVTHLQEICSLRFWVAAADPAFRFNGDLRTLQQANRDTTDSNADNEDDIAVTFTRRRVDPMPRDRRFDRTPVPPAEDGSFFRHVPNHNPTGYLMIVIAVYSVVHERRWQGLEETGISKTVPAILSIE
ncbi:hypothetical protein V1504DRAFT_431989 [Lipomyces starkeyi]